MTITVSLQSDARRTMAVMSSSMNKDDIAEYSFQILVADSSFKLYTAGCSQIGLPQTCTKFQVGGKLAFQARLPEKQKSEVPGVKSPHCIHDMIYVIDDLCRMLVSISVVGSAPESGDASPGDHNISDATEIVPGVRVCATRDRGREGHWEQGG